ncbi:MAG: ABC transporter permease [Desulfobacterales bacterium]|uniref:ABC transporter permease n=1 Tax=Candidatus Desulfatibia vada TaxID=2841696 RepID=A0A8J6P256_9BACT|nr:ABC transporter permease [Candidatus Desulfatibia vada]
MTLKEIAFRNLIRRKGKAAFILAGLIIGVTTVVAVISMVEAMTSDINEKLEKYGANILVVPKTENLSLTYGGLSLGGVSFEMEEIKEKELEQISSIKYARNVAAVGPLVLGVINVNAHRVLLAGVDFEAAGILKPWWRINGTQPAENSVLLGAETARVMELDIGGTIEIKGRRLQVSGVLEPTGSQDDQLVFVRLATAQSLLDKPGRISMAEVAALCTACPIEEMVKQISQALPGAKVMAIQQVVKGRMETLSQFKKLSYGVSAVVVLIGSLVVLVTMMGSVRERTQEIGIFRAIGFRKKHVMGIVFIEAGIVSGLAGIIGYLLGFVGTKIGLRFFTESQTIAVPLNLELAGGAFLLAVLVGLAASIYPALMAARLDPNVALRAL